MNLKWRKALASRSENPVQVTNVGGFLTAYVEEANDKFVASVMLGTLDHTTGEYEVETIIKDERFDTLEEAQERCEEVLERAMMERLKSDF